VVADGCDEMLGLTGCSCDPATLPVRPSVRALKACVPSADLRPTNHQPSMPVSLHAPVVWKDHIVFLGIDR
jgi:hypothetical protein